MSTAVRLNLQRYPSGSALGWIFSNDHWSYHLTFGGEQSHDPDALVVWRFRLENPRTGQRQGFASLAELISFLQGQLIDRVDE